MASHSNRADNIIELTEVWDPGHPTVLIVEDNVAYQKLTCKVLERNGYKVQVANNGAEALEILESAQQFEAGSQSFDLILMDIQMSVMGGIEATDKIRAREEGSGTRVPIVALTAMIEEQERCLGSGIDDFVAKPLEPKKLLDVISRLLQNEREIST